MARWDAGAAERLREAALDLFGEHGYDAVTVTQIAERAGLTRRTFHRHFPDKREILFAGSERLPPAVAEAVLAADPGLPPLRAALSA
ncbi:helix-turn-helix domain-containing protein, partial [Streptomyces sp. NPDC005840]